MNKKKNPDPILKETIFFETIVNIESLNIFCDASMRSFPNNPTGCYGIVAVCCNNIIDFDTRYSSHSTNNETELKGLRGAILMASKWKQYYPFINIFCDSQFAILGLREYIWKWKIKDGNYINSLGKVTAHQEIFIECNQLLTNLQLTNRVHLYHQLGHISNGIDELQRAARSFEEFNHVNAPIDLNLIRYISSWNNYVDNKSRQQLRPNGLSNENYRDPIKFHLQI